MISLLIAAGVALIVSIFGTRFAIGYFRRRSIGQFIQEEIAGMHAHKQGTPTMGGIVFVGAAVIGYAVSHFRIWTPSGFEFEVLEFAPGGLLAIFALTGMALVGLADDWIKYSNRRSLGLSKVAKFGGQLVIASLFAWGATSAGVVTEISFVRPLGLDLGVFFVIWVLLMLTGAANGVNLSDGMDGLAAGSWSWLWRRSRSSPSGSSETNFLLGIAISTRRLTPWSWRWCRPRCSGQSSGFCGGMRLRRR